MYESDTLPLFEASVVSEKHGDVQEPERLKAYHDYPALLSNQRITGDLEILSSRFHEWAEDGFLAEDSKHFRVDVYEIHDRKQDHDTSQFAFTTAAELEGFLLAGRKPRVRIMYTMFEVHSGWIRG